VIEQRKSSTSVSGSTETMAFARVFNISCVVLLSAKSMTHDVN
jgi:hypothetical protein